MLQRLVDNGEFPTVSEAVRHAVRDLVEKRGDRAVRESDQVSVKV
ncbi:Arc/MetJ-type ribon-helix-helix transcriptional regulator [Methanofollis sp. W23]|nr:Arc/MetJ-type ribon-helix-helix transcriptional regulator [Methanofollis sp. W23]